MNSYDIDLSLLNAKHILEKYSALYNKTTDEILDYYENKKDMLHDRWSVAAYVLLSRIQQYDVNNLINKLPNENNGDLLFQITGYILQKEHHMDLEELIIESDEHKEYDKIIRYVKGNLQYKKEFNPQHFILLFNVIDNNENESNNDLIRDYSKHINNCDAFHFIYKRLLDIKSDSEYQLVKDLASDWYKKDKNQADKFCVNCLKSKNNLNQRIAMYYLSYSINYSTELFEMHINDIDSLYDSGEEIKRDIISLYIKYIVINKSKNSEYQSIIIERLKSILTDTPDTKRVFLDGITYNEDIPEELISIYTDIIQKPLCDENLLKDIDNFLYLENERNPTHNIIQDLLTIFKSNDYTSNYYSFFNGFSSVLSILNKQQNNMTENALMYMASDDIHKVFLGLGLVDNTSNIIKNINETILRFTEKQLIQMLKGHLYFSQKGDLTCHLAFALFELCEKDLTAYSQFCMNEVFENYSVKMYDYSKKQFNELKSGSKELAKKIIAYFETRLEKQQLVQSVMDMRPSVEHQRLILKAKLVKNQQIMEKADAMSFTAALFPKQKMKYGKRFSYLINQGNGVKEFQESSYHSFAQEMVLPMQYVSDPVQFYEKRIAFFQEVKNGAINY